MLRLVRADSPQAFRDRPLTRPLVFTGQNLGSALAFLRDTAQMLEERLADSANLAEMVKNFDSRPLDEIEEVSTLSRSRLAAVQQS